MKHLTAFLFLAIAAGAYLSVSRMPDSDSGLPSVTELRDPEPPLEVTGRGADEMSRAALWKVDAAFADASAIDRPDAGARERELIERLQIAFNSGLDETAKPVEYERIVQLIRENPELARALAKDGTR